MQQNGILPGWNIVTFFILIIASDAQTCFKAKVKNGNVKMRSGGKIAIYECRRGYTMDGKKVAVCLSGRWNHPPPKCIAAGCPDVVDNTGLMIKSLYDGSKLSFSCPTAYKLQGPVEIFCDKTNWDQHPPACQEIPTGNTTPAAVSSTTSLPDTTKATTTGTMTTPKPPAPKPTSIPKPPTPKPKTPKPPTPTMNGISNTTVTENANYSSTDHTPDASPRKSTQDGPNDDYLTLMAIGIASGVSFTVIVIAIFAWVWAKKKNRRNRKR